MAKRILKQMMVYFGKTTSIKCTFCDSRAEYTLHTLSEDGSCGDALGDFCLAHADEISKEMQRVGDFAQG